MEKLQSKFKSKKRSIPYVFLSHFLLAIQIFGQAQSFELYPEYQEFVRKKREGNYINAIQALDEVLLKAKSNSDIYSIVFLEIEKASIFRTIGKYKIAFSILDSIIINYSDLVSENDIQISYKFERGVLMLNQGNFEEGKSNLLESINASIDFYGKNDTILAPIYGKLGNYYFLTKNYDSALVFYNKAYSLALNKKDSLKDISSYIANQAICFSSLGQYQYSEKLFHIALENLVNSPIKDDYLLFKIYNNLGKFYFDLSAYDKALEMFEKADELSLENKMQNATEKGSLEWNRSLALLYQGNLPSAIQYILEARHLFESECFINNSVYSALIMDQAYIYYKSSLTDEAIKLYRLSLKNAALPVKIKTYRNLGILYYDQNQLKEAGLYFDTCYALIKQLANPSPVEIAYTDLYYGNYLIKIDDPGTLLYLNNSLKIFNNIFGNKHRDVAAVYQVMGDYYLSQNNPDEALKSFHQGLVSVTPSFNDTSLLANPVDTALSVDGVSVRILKRKAATLEIFYARNSEFKYLESLLEIHNLLIYTVEQYAKYYRHEDSRLDLTEEFHDLYKDAVELNLLAYETTKSARYLNQAFEISEKSKAAVLLSAVKDENASNMGLVPDSLYQLEKMLRGNLYLYNVKISEEENRPVPNSGKLEFMRSGLFNNEKKYDSLLDIYAMQYPEYYKLKYNSEVISIRDLQKIMNEDDILIEYVLSDTLLITFIISRQDFQYRKAFIKPDFKDKIFALRHNLYPPNASKYNIEDYREFQSLAFELYLKLLAPVKGLLGDKNLIIIPDGELAYLSFESLIEYKTDSKTINFRDLPYLLKRHAFHYASSATIFSLCENVKRPRMRKGILSLAPSYPLVKKGIIQQYGDFGGVLLANRDLPGAFWEAEKILNFIDGDKLTGSDATESQFKAKAGDYDILHFAMHTEINDENPLSSRLSFYPQGDCNEDDVLHTYEIYNLRLKGHLAVLSACSTGSGKLQKGEGVISLARAFIIAGIPSILMTLWDIEDLSSGFILPNFYYLYSKGIRKDEALRQAKLNYIKNAPEEIEAHPAFWSGYVLYGNNKPFRQSNTRMYFISLVILGLMIVILSYVIYRKYSKFKSQSENLQNRLDLSAKLRSKDRF